MGDEMHRRDPSSAGLLTHFHTAWAIKQTSERKADTGLTADDGAVIRHRQIFGRGVEHYIAGAPLKSAAAKAAPHIVAARGGKRDGLIKQDRVNRRAARLP